MKQITLLFFLMYSALAVAQDNFEALGTLPDEIMETSGLLFFDGKLITHNDSGNTPNLYELDTTSLTISRTVTIENIVNTDWEDLAQDDNFIYIGDFGNNVGTRTDLRVYRVDKSSFLSENTVTAEEIAFSYSDQTDFSGAQNSDFDAEAMIVYKDQLIIFTKQWQTNGTVAYAIPKTPGVHIAQPVAMYNSNGLVTGATYDVENDLLFLCGYSQQLQPFVIYTEGISTNFNFNTTTSRVSLPLSFAQIEGISQVGNGRYFLSSEKFTNANPPITLESTLYAFNFNVSTAPPPDPNPDPTPDPDEEPYIEGVTIVKPRGSNVVYYDLFGDRQLFGRAIFDSSGRLIQYARVQEIEQNEIDITGLGSAVYYLTFYLRGRTISEPFVVE